MAVISLLPFVSSCVASSASKPPTPTPIPALDARTATPCPNPGIAPVYGEALLEVSKYAACSARKHADAVAAYNDVQKRFGPK